MIFIRHQGELLGETELAARLVAHAYRPFRRFGPWAAVIRLHARLSRVVRPTNRPTQEPRHEQDQPS